LIENGGVPGAGLLDSRAEKRQKQPFLMPANAIALGIGHPPGDPNSETRLDVHLHPDALDGPLSLGESWGRMPGIGAQMTLQQAAAKDEAHLRACGCEWLLLLATEEKLRGRIFTPQEILARRPVSQTPLPQTKPQKPARAARAAAEVLPRIRLAISEGDFEALETLRDVLDAESVQQLAAEWRADLPWSIKDAYAAILLDQTADCVQPLFRDALKSPTAETRAYALCVITGDFGRFDQLLTQGGVDAAKVDAAIARAGLA
jgi:hypothetical protein